MMDVVMGAANRAEPTIRGLDTRNVMNGWCIQDRGRIKSRQVWGNGRALTAAICLPISTVQTRNLPFGDFSLPCYVQDTILRERAIPFT